MVGRPADRWLKLAVELRGEELSGECDGVPLRPGPTTNGAKLRARYWRPMMETTLRNIAREPGVPAPPVPVMSDGESLFGLSLGVFVWNATLSVRQARIVPLPPGESP